MPTPKFCSQERASGTTVEGGSSTRFGGTARRHSRAGLAIFCGGLTVGGALHAGTEDDATRSADEDSSGGDWEVALKSTAGWQSNPFEVNNRQEKTRGDGFVASALDVTRPLDGEDGDWSGVFTGTEKKYFREGQLDEYELKAGVNWQVLDRDGLNLILNLRGSRFRERIYNEFQSKPNRSALGWSGGAGWKMEAALSGKFQVTWEGGADYQTFDEMRLDNLKLRTSADFEYQWSDDLTWVWGTKTEFQNYPVRPPDSETQGGPRGLQTLEAHLSAGIEAKVGGGWTLEIIGNGGPNFDLTNGYFNSRELGAQVELRWERENWKVQFSLEPEWIWFDRRPANRNTRGRMLVTQENLFETSVEYALTENLSFLGQAGLHLQNTNSKQATGDATLEHFADVSVVGGISLVY